MHKRILQSLVVVLILGGALAALTGRTKKLWSTQTRQVTQETLESQLIVLRHLVGQRSNSLAENLLATINGKTSGKFLYTRTLVLNSQGKWTLSENNEVPSTNSYFAKNIDLEAIDSNLHWHRISDAKGDLFAGLFLPINYDAGMWKLVGNNSSVKAMGFGVIKEPFSDLLEIFKGGFASFMVIDSQQKLIEHTNEEYKGATVAKELNKILKSDRQEAFFRYGSNKSAGQLVSVQKLSDAGLVLAAEVPERNGMILFYKWLFEVIGGGLFVLFALSGVIFWQRETADVIAKEVSPVNGRSIIQSVQKAFTGLSRKAGESIKPLEVKPLGLAAESSADVENSKSDMNLKPIIISALAEFENDIRIYGVQIEEILEDVPNIMGVENQIKSAIYAILGLSFANVRQKMARKINIHLSRRGQQIVLMIQDNGLPRQSDIAFELPQMFLELKSYGAEIMSHYDAYKGNLISLKFPLEQKSTHAEVMTAKDLPKNPMKPTLQRKTEEINKRFNQLKLQDLPVNVRKPKVKEIEND